MQSKALLSPDHRAVWLTDGFTTTKTPVGPSQMLIVGRYIYAGDTAVRAATVSYFKIPRFSADGKATNNNDLFKMISSGIGVKTWGHREVGSSDVWETYWPHGNRYVRIYAREHKDFIEYSLALVRNTYAQGIKRESEIIQKGLFKLLPLQDKKDKSDVGVYLRSILGIDMAQAQTLPTGIIPPVAFPIDSKTIGQITQELQTTMTEAQQGLTAIKGLIPTITQFGANVNTDTKYFGQITSDTNALTKELIPDLHSMTQSLHDYDTVMKKVTSSEFIIKSTAEVAATASATQMGMELLFKGGKKLLEAAKILKDPKYAQETELAAEAWKGYKALDEARETTENLINKRFKAIQDVYSHLTYKENGVTKQYDLMDVNTREKLLSFLAGRISYNQHKLDLSNKNSENCEGDDCENEAANANSKYTKKIADDELLVKQIDAVRNSFCYDLSKDIDNVVDYEKLIEKSESDILKLEPMKWEADHKANQTTAKNIKDSQSNSNIGKVSEEIGKNIGDVRVAERNSIIGFKNQAAKNCNNTFTSDNAGGGVSQKDIEKFCEHYTGFVKSQVIAACVEDFTNQDSDGKMVKAKDREKSCKRYDDFLKSEKLSDNDKKKFFGKFSDPTKASGDFDKLALADEQGLKEKIDDNRTAEYIAQHTKDDRIKTMKATQGTESQSPITVAMGMQSDGQALDDANRDLASAQTKGDDGKVLRAARIKELLDHKSDIVSHCTGKGQSATQPAPPAQVNDREHNSVDK